MTFQCTTAFDILFFDDQSFQQVATFEWPSPVAGSQRGRQIADLFAPWLAGKR